jgi:hypothetical protein
MRKLTFALVIIAFWCAPTKGTAQQLTIDQLGRESLRGLKGIWLSVAVGATTTPEKQSIQYSLQTEVEVQLRQAGIRILTREEWNNEPGKPWLLVVATVHDAHAEFRQQVQLTRETSIMTVGETWRTGGQVVANDPDPLSALRRAVREEVTKFVNSFLTMNAK